MTVVSSPQSTSAFGLEAIKFSDIPPSAISAVQTELDMWKLETQDVPDNAFLVSDGVADTYIFEGSVTETDGAEEIDQTLVFSIDLNPDEEPIGLGWFTRVNRCSVGGVSKVPYVSWTQTLEGETNRGLGMRRLRVMNEIANLRFGTPLSSDSCFFSEFAIKAWERLVRTGEAEPYEDNGLTRFRFK